MKRCPQCEFIYEDDQSLCDMDGALLVLDSRTLPNPRALATVPAPPRTQRRGRVVPAIATLILALVLGMVYYVSTRPRIYTPPSRANGASNPAPVSITAPPEPVKEEPVKAEPVKEDPKPEAAKSPTTAPVKKVTTKAAAHPQPKKSTGKKEDSKVGSILKKTGRILKKPFKL